MLQNFGVYTRYLSSNDLTRHTESSIFSFHCLFAVCLKYVLAKDCSRRSSFLKLKREVENSRESPKHQHPITLSHLPTGTLVLPQPLPPFPNPSCTLPCFYWSRCLWPTTHTTSSKGKRTWHHLKQWKKYKRTGKCEISCKRKSNLE